MAVAVSFGLLSPPATSAGFSRKYSQRNAAVSVGGASPAVETEMTGFADADSMIAIARVQELNRKETICQKSVAFQTNRQIPYNTHLP
jgi:hypothetical protein